MAVDIRLGSGFELLRYEVLQFIFLRIHFNYSMCARAMHACVCAGTDIREFEEIKFYSTW